MLPINRRFGHPKLVLGYSCGVAVASARTGAPMGFGLEVCVSLVVFVWEGKCSTVAVVIVPRAIRVSTVKPKFGS